MRSVRVQRHGRRGTHSVAAGGETLSGDETEARTNSPRCLSHTKTSLLEAFFRSNDQQQKVSRTLVKA